MRFSQANKANIFITAMRQKSLKPFCYLLIGLLPVISLTTTVHSAELVITHSQNEAKQEYALTLDQIEQLAGLKISLSYPETLHYQSLHKDSRFNSFLHVVNDKVPGKLIVVMASAKGVSGDDVSPFVLNFTTPAAATAPTTPALKITGCELMSEKLVEIPCNTSEDLQK